LSKDVPFYQGNLISSPFLRNCPYLRCAHHPHKTWFLIDAEASGNAGQTAVIGNICPRLRPLHTLLAIPPESAAAREQYHGMLSAVFEKYLHLAKHALVCPGSVGQPRNGNYGAQFAVYDREKKALNCITLPYEVAGVVKRMQDYRLPEALWQRLLTGT
jgi:hypothetical protein